MSGLTERAIPAPPPLQGGQRPQRQERRGQGRREKPGQRSVRPTPGVDEGAGRRACLRPPRYLRSHQRGRLHDPWPPLPGARDRRAESAADCRARQQHRRSADRPCLGLPGVRAAGRRARSGQPGGRGDERRQVRRSGQADPGRYLGRELHARRRRGFGRRARAGGPPRGTRRPRRRWTRARADDRQRAI